MGAKVERQCPVCGKSYIADATRLRWGRETTCSRDCSYKLRGDNLSDQEAFVCPICGKEFARCRSHIKGKHGSQFCSRACHYIGRSAGLSKRVVAKPYVYTKQGAVSLSVHAALQYASGRTLSYPQTEIAAVEALLAAGVEFRHQQVFLHPGGAFCCDFFFPSMNAVVELDSPTAHRRGNKSDAERDAFLNEIGIRVIRIPDEGDTEEVTALLLAALGLR